MHGMGMLDEATKPPVEARLKRIAGQVAGIQRMVEQDRYCVDVVMQVSAVRAALAKVSKLMLDQHIQTCVSTAMNGDDPTERQSKIDELLKIFDKNCNC